MRCKLSAECWWPAAASRELIAGSEADPRERAECIDPSAERGRASGMHCCDAAGRAIVIGGARVVVTSSASCSAGAAVSASSTRGNVALAIGAG